VLVGLALVAELPAFGRLRVLGAPRLERPAPTAAEARPVLSVGEAELGAASGASPGLTAPTPSAASRGPIGGQREAPLDLNALAAEPPPLPLLDPSGRALDAFFRALARTERSEPHAITRIAHFGDSVIVSDYVSATLRRKLQGRFGDAGHGFVLMASAWPAYFHDGVERMSTRGFRASRIVGPTARDGLYGLGGVTFRSGPGAIAEFATADAGPIGRTASRFLVSYLEQPGGGFVRVEVDGVAAARIATAGPRLRHAAHALSVPDAAHRFRIAFEGAESRTFGVVLERDAPGVVLDALGVQGARVRFLDESDDEHWAEVLRWRSPDLVVYQFGANESGDGFAYPMEQYLRTMKAVVAQGQRARPASSCLIVGAMDRARIEDGVTTSMRIIPLLVAEQRRAALELGCAYFDTYAAMGGWGSMPTWVRRGLGQADMTHPTGVGAERIGNWLYGALMERYLEYRTRSAREALDAPAPGAADPSALPQPSASPQPSARP
jgi:lysophospholipase L1-like esterase